MIYGCCIGVCSDIIGRHGCHASWFGHWFVVHQLLVVHLYVHLYVLLVVGCKVLGFGYGGSQGCEWLFAADVLNHDFHLWHCMHIWSVVFHIFRESVTVKVYYIMRSFAVSIGPSHLHWLIGRLAKNAWLSADSFEMILFVCLFIICVDIIIQQQEPPWRKQKYNRSNQSTMWADILELLLGSGLQYASSLLGRWFLLPWAYSHQIPRSCSGKSGKWVLRDEFDPKQVSPE